MRFSITLESTVDELIQVRHSLLQQVGSARGALVEQRQRVFGVCVLAQDHDSNRRCTPPQLIGHPDSFIRVGRRHPDVGQHDLRAFSINRRSQ